MSIRYYYFQPEINFFTKTIKNVSELEGTMPIIMYMEGTMPIILEGTPPLRGVPYPTF